MAGAAHAARGDGSRTFSVWGTEAETASGGAVARSSLGANPLPAATAAGWGA